MLEGIKWQTLAVAVLVGLAVGVILMLVLGFYGGAIGATGGAAMIAAALTSREREEQEIEQLDVKLQASLEQVETQRRKNKVLAKDELKETVERIEDDSRRLSPEELRREVMKGLKDE